LEATFGQLIKALAVDNITFSLMFELANQYTEANSPSPHEDMGQTRQRQIRKFTQKLENTRLLFREAEYRAHMADYGAELAYWEANTTEQEAETLQLERCLEALQHMAALWDRTDAAERRAMAHYLFDYRSIM
jgi:hypothetical protein